MTLITPYKHMTPTRTLFILSISTHISYETVEAVRNFRTKTTDSSASVAAALSAIIIVAFCLFMCRVFCPNGPEFTALDLDEIRLERLQSIEDRIKQNIRDLKAKLSFHKKKRQTVERERDLKLRLQSYVAGEAADDSDDDAERGRLLPREEKKGPDRTNILEQENLFNSPIRNFPSPEKKGRRVPLPVTSPSPPPHKLIRDYEEEKEDKEDEKEEKEDLWKMWDKVASHKTATKTLTQHTDTAVDKQKSYHSIRYENKANRKEFLASMMSEPREEKADDYNTAMMYTESQWQSRPSAKKDQDYSINVSVKDYRSAEKYTVDVSSNPLLSQQQAQQPPQTSSSTEIMSPLLKMAAKKQSDVTPHPPTQPPPPRASKPAPPKGPPPPHVLLKRKLEKMQAPQRVRGGEVEEEREKDD